MSVVTTFTDSCKYGALIFGLQEKQTFFELLSLTLARKQNKLGNAAYEEQSTN